MASIDPPAGYDDMLGDAEQVEGKAHLYHPVKVEGVGTIMARKPMPNSIPALAMAANSKIDSRGQCDYLMLFVQNHVPDLQLESLLLGMMRGEYPQDTMSRVTKAISTWGTARPTQPSSTCR